MKRELVKSMTDTFQDHSNTTDNGIEFWFARDIQHLLGYSEWERLHHEPTLKIKACKRAAFVPTHTYYISAAIYI